MNQGRDLKAGAEIIDELNMDFDIEHLADVAPYSIQRQDGLLIYSVVQYMYPKTIVEFGFAAGHSSRNFLKAMSGECRLYSFDPSKSASHEAEKINDSRFTFFNKRGQEFKADDIEHRKIDILFLDTDHKFLTNRAIFKKVRRYLSDNCMIFVHDTGLFNKDFMRIPWTTDEGYFVTERGYAHRPEERLFVNYLSLRYPEFHQIHFDTERSGRCGMTLLSRYRRLPLSRRFFKLVYDSVLKPAAKKLFKRTPGK